MRFGGHIFQEWHTPEEWALAARKAGYSAVYFPVDYAAPLSVIDGFCNAARAADLTICEIGVWNNTLDPDAVKRESAISRAIHQLELAEYVGANCCVNIAGTYNKDIWDGPHPENFSRRAFDAIVSTTQYIIDAVHPRVTAYSLEPMPFMPPDTADGYLALIKAIDRRGFAAHLDIVNVVVSPRLYYSNADLIREWFGKLGAHIRSCHAKDIRLGDGLTVHLSECRPGTGGLDYGAYLTCASKLDDNVCIMLEHMTEENDYVEATRYLKGLAVSLGLTL